MSGFPIHSLSGLIIDDQPEMCKQLYTMLERIGLRRIAVCHTGDKAIEAMSKSKFDVILCDYDLGRGKDGLQVLEEGKHREIILNTSCFIMITAIQSNDMVIGAIEHQPDAYIIKPITFDDIRLRLERTLNIKDTYYNIFHNIDLKQYNAALSACEQLTKARPKLSLSVLKFKAKIYFKQEQYDKAEAIYTEVLQIRKLPWAFFGLAKAYFFQKKYKQASQILESLIAEHQNYITAYDLLAQIKELQGDKVGAQKALQSAVSYSPRAVRRQTFLSRIATENQDWTAALPAARKSVELGRHSIFKTPENYIHLTASLQPQLYSESLSDRRSASAEILKTMDHFKKDFPEDTTVQVSAYFIESSTHKQMGQEREQEKYLNMATNLMDTHHYELKEEALELISNRLSLTCDPETIQVFIDSELCKNLSTQAKTYIDNKAQEKATKDNQEKIDKYNNKGVEFFERGALAEAIQMFEKATEHATASFSVLLNAMQAHIAYLEQHGKDQTSMSACGDLMNRLNEMPPTDRRQARKKRLEALFNKLEETWST
ncbi:MAG TPA: hypothetical protein DHW71_03130 [Gammaproteobacteria bacterium]|nr:hypothetical protein [Gammaproteobacteria bacterium]MEC8011789.1 response regulator [Pseudomonadota bacterium]HBF08179.1 hypothetical protein [Gammaproteobacteria bacterium]HCK91950.1 hypothetical protein [Gammaproteobacteria bacterium]|tara:strand:+ start:8074 stop:9708 length:1635 start_codon:yes stop_codon:yes gene_type:complete